MGLESQVADCEEARGPPLGLSQPYLLAFQRLLLVAETTQAPYSIRGYRSVLEKFVAKDITQGPRHIYSISISMTWGL